MIENHLLILVNNVKKQTLVSFLCVLLVGCDNATVLVSFTPEMASFSNEFDFDPLRGPVKDFSQTLMNDKGEVTKRISGTLSQEGCFDTLELHDLENNTGLALVLDANYYRDAETMEKRVRLQGKCQLAELPSAGVVWDTDDNGFVVSATGRECCWRRNAPKTAATGCRKKAIWRISTRNRPLNALSGLRSHCARRPDKRSVIRRYCLCRLRYCNGVSPIPLPKALIKYVTSENPTCRAISRTLSSLCNNASQALRNRRVLR